MEFEHKHADEVLSGFLKSWNVERIRTMSLIEYAHLEDHDSLCYWLEYGTKYLGAIGRISLNKFELWEIQNDKDFKDDRFKKQNGYAWNRNKGQNLTEAFVEVRRLVVDVVEKSLAGEWQAIEHIPFHSIGKWKLAFLFSDKRLLPVYSKRALLAISDGLGLEFTSNAQVYQLQEGILTTKPDNEDVIDYSNRLYDQFARSPVEPNYYLFGSKYGANDETPVMKDFIANSCVAMGWIWDKDFSQLMGAEQGQVDAWVIESYKDSKPELGKIKGYFRLFSRIKAGDIIAVKSHGRFNKLKIIGYAQVVERDGSVYFFDEDILSHHICVEFLDTSFLINFEYTYAGTIHQLTAKKDGDAFYDIFNWFSNVSIIEDEDNTVIDTEAEAEFETDDSGYNEKDEGTYERSAIASTTVNRIHNRIQNRFIEYLNLTYPNDACSGEKRYIDAKRVTATEYIIYEIKPFASVYTCIKEGIGQLFDYMHKEVTKKNKQIMIVGPNRPEGRDLDFIEELRTLLNVPFGYLAFDEKKMQAVEY